MRPRGTFDERDDVDVLFARLRSVAPPPDMKANILRALPANLPSPAPAPSASPGNRATAGSTFPWRWVAVGTGLLLAIMSLRLGGLLDDSGAFSVLAEIFSDFSGFLSSPGDYLTPLLSELPWFDLIIALAALITFWVSSSASVDQAQSSRTRAKR